MKKKIGKSEKIFLNYLKVITQFMGGRSYSPLSSFDLQERLKVPENHKTIFKKALLALIHEKTLESRDGRYFLKESSEQIVVGTLRMHPRGFGFLQPNDPVQFPQDIFIPKHLTKNAVDGDIVEVLINPESFSEKGPEGKVISIVRRSRTHVAGTVWKIDHDVNYVHVPLLGSSKTVIVTPIDERKLRLGDRIIMKIVEWGGDGRATLCEMSHYLGNIEDPSCDVKAAIEEFDLRSDFLSKVLEEAKSYSPTVSLSEIKKRTDLRKLETFTIDPDTARDFDDALSLSVDEKGYHLGVHIADVSHYVKSGSALDEEAKIRCNSTYFPGYCLPMLPKELSDDLCSLKPKVNRLTLSVMMDFDHEGTLLNYKIFRSCIKSQKRFTYKEAKKVLDGKKRSKHAPTLNNMVELCRLLKKKRYERGSIEFALDEMVVIVDEKGIPQKMERIEYDITHQLVEEFMLKANEVVATYLTEKGEHLTYRVHDEPAEDNLKEFGNLARAFGFNFPNKKPSTHDLQKLFEEVKGTPYASQLATSFIRSMKLAYYSPSNVGHFGLSLQYYCHFTSPIRRYVDLIVHRIVCGETHAIELLSAACHACSEQERISAKAEQATTLLKKLRLLDAYYKEDPERVYKAHITRVKNMGIIFDIQDLMIDGFLHVSELDNDYFVYDEKRIALIGAHTNFTYTCGKEILLKLKRLDFITLQSDWTLVHQRKRRKK